MAFVVTKLPDEPIILLRVDLPFEQHRDTLHHVAARCARLAVDHGGLLYRILDGWWLNASYSDILLLIDDHKHDYPGSLRDPHIRTVFAGDSPLLELAARKIHQQLSITVPVYPTLDAALVAIRAELAAQVG